jgi:hypothetical protein
MLRKCLSEWLKIASSSISHSQRRLSGSVRPDHGDSAVQTDINIDGMQDLLAGCVCKADFVQLQQRRRNLFWVGESVKVLMISIAPFPAESEKVTCLNVSLSSASGGSSSGSFSKILILD